MLMHFPDYPEAMQQYDGGSNCFQYLETLPVRAQHIREATRADPELSQVCLYTVSGWPSDVPEELKPYYLSWEWKLDACFGVPGW